MPLDIGLVAIIFALLAVLGLVIFIQTPKPPASVGAPPNSSEDERRLERAVKLKQYAVDNGLTIDESLTEDITELTAPRRRPPSPRRQKPAPATSQNPASPGPTSSAANRTQPLDPTRLDSVIRRLTRITFPITINDMPVDGTAYDSARAENRERYANVLGIAGLLGFAVAVAGLALSLSGTSTFLWNSVLAGALGLLGGVVYSAFIMLRVTASGLFRIDDLWENVARLALGVLLGWVSYFAFDMDVFSRLATAATAGVSSPDPNNVRIILPFLVGYSADFMAKLINRALVAVSTTFGLDTDPRVSSRPKGE